MKLQTEVSAEKLRGGFYSPASLVRTCLDRAAQLLEGRVELRVVEPSAGDGAFIRGLASHRLRDGVSSFTAIEILPSEAAAAGDALALTTFAGNVLCRSALEWSLEGDDQFDLALGNPPFVRFQFVSDNDRMLLDAIGKQVGVSFSGVGNLWIPVLLGALNRLAAGGVFAFIIPAECFTGISAGGAREWLLRWADSLHFDLFEPGSFPGVLQEVVIVSGRRRTTANDETAEVSFTEAGRSWSHRVAVGGQSWTRLLLRAEHLCAIEEMLTLDCARRLGDIARFEVSTVTGANKFFSVTRAQVRQHELDDWIRPLLPRIRHAKGLIFDEEEHAEFAAGVEPAYLLHFGVDRPNPLESINAAAYLASGVEQGLPDRYKCRIREPWYRVSVVEPGELMLSKRSHRFPRLVRNTANALTTDTIYRGTMKPGIPPQRLVACFHSTATLLTAEMEGRSFGGGVLEVVPSEVARLLVLVPAKFESHLSGLDQLVRLEGADNDRLVDRTDELLMSAEIGLTSELLDTLRDARLLLLNRRLARN